MPTLNHMNTALPAGLPGAPVPQQARILIDYADVVAFGIMLSKSQLWRLERAGRFPRRVRVGGGQRYAWVRQEVIGWIQEQIALRDHP
jgi:prophage regulatory protein